MRGCRSSRTSPPTSRSPRRHLAVEVDRDTASRLGVSLSADRPDPLRRLRRAPGGDDLQLDHPVQGAARGRAGVRAAIRPRCRASISRAPTALQVPLSTVASFVNKVSPLTINHQGQFPVGDAVLQPGARRGAGRGGRADRRAARELNVPFTVAGRLPGHGAGLPGLARHDAVPDRGGDPRCLYRAGHAVRERTFIPSPSCRPCPRPASAPCWR